MTERICREAVMMEYETLDPNGNRVKKTGAVPCNSRAWSYETTVSDLRGNPGRPGETISVTRTVKTNRLFCENGHPLGGY